MPATVVLEHTQADGRSHFDWMIEDPALVGENRLATWRVATRPDLADGGESFAAERIGDHRDRYLHYEGPLSDGRGRVRRVGLGTVEWERCSSETIEIRVRWSGGRAARLTGRRLSDADWSWRSDPV